MVQGDGGEVADIEAFAARRRGWHEAALEAGGGAPGEHTDRLLASCGRAFQTFGGEDVFPTEFDKAAALFHGIICNHAFVDGNKRTASVTALLFLTASGQLVRGLTDFQLRLIGELAVATAMSQFDVDEVARWLHRVLDP